MRNLTLTPYNENTCRHRLSSEHRTKISLLENLTSTGRVIDWSLNMATESGFKLIILSLRALRSRSFRDGSLSQRSLCDLYLFVLDTTQHN